MSNISVGFIRASLVYLLVGITIGLIMALPGGYAWLTAVALGTPSIAHAHALLPGFMLMMVMGTAYHIFPRFTGNPIKSQRLVWINFWACQIGVAGMVSGFLFRGLVPWLMPTGAIIQTVGMALFAFNMLQVVKPLKRLTVQGAGGVPVQR